MRYEITDEFLEVLKRNFSYHAPKGDQVDRYQEIRNAAYEFAVLLTECCPRSRERTTALNKLDECVALANASIARNE